MNPSFLFVEIAALFLFLAGAFESRKKGLPRLLEFVMIFFYGLLLEELDMRIFKSYHYSPHFLLTIGQVPLSIAWLWAVILASSMAISDRAGLPIFIRPFVDALLAVWIDLSLDAIAIRMGYWSWAIPLKEGWFGVPAGNLYAWMWVAFFYSACTRGVRHLVKKDEKWSWLSLFVPIVAYLGLFLAMISIGFVGKSLGLVSQKEKLYLFWMQFSIFVVMALAGWRRRYKTDEAVRPIWWWSRLAIHLYFLTSFFFQGLYYSFPILGLIAFITLGGEMVLRQTKILCLCLLFLTLAASTAKALEDSRNPEDWYERARGDLEVGELILQKTNQYGPVCFHAHQAVEKTLKGTLIGKGINPGQTHLNSKLLGELLHFRPELSSLESECHSLDGLYTPSRYPKPGLVITKDKATHCLEISGKILNALGTGLPISKKG